MRRQATMFPLALLLLQVAGCPQPTDDAGRPQPDTPSTYGISATITGNGRIQSSATSADVAPGTSVTFLAIPSAGWRFVRWDGASTSTDPLLSLTITDNVTLAAIFEVEPPPPPSDVDADGIPDASDNCPVTPNPDQADSNGDGLGDACTPVFTIDFDGDGVDDSVDNCLLFANPDQADTDGDGLGDACELMFDFDGDGVEDSIDNCIITPNPNQADSDGDGIGDACEIVVPPPPPGGTATIVGIYGGDVIELSDGSVWEVTFGFTLGWFPGDPILVQGSRLINLDEVEEVTANRLGQAVLHDRIDAILSSGEFLRLAGGTVWHINSLDRFRVAIWLPIQRVVVVQASAFSYRIVRETDGQIVGATP